MLFKNSRVFFCTDKFLMLSILGRLLHKKTVPETGTV